MVTRYLGYALAQVRPSQRKRMGMTGAPCPLSQRRGKQAARLGPEAEFSVFIVP